MTARRCHLLEGPELAVALALALAFGSEPSKVSGFQISSFDSLEMASSFPSCCSTPSPGGPGVLVVLDLLEALSHLVVPAFLLERNNNAQEEVEEG